MKNNKDINKNKYRLQTKPKLLEAINILNDFYPNATCSLNYNSALELTVALILAAQCTDERVNKITPILFKRYPNVDLLAAANILELEKIIKPCGFYRTKAKNIIATANIIVNNFNKEVPCTMKNLCSLSGIGRKSSNIILQECFGTTEGIAVDTHVTRLSRRIGFTKNNTAETIEKDLMKKVPKPYWRIINNVFVYHGRKICSARKPLCDECPINHLCMKNFIHK